jgi:hypothetical protein
MTAEIAARAVRLVVLDIEHVRDTRACCISCRRCRAPICAGARFNEPPRSAGADLGAAGVVVLTTPDMAGGGGMMRHPGGPGGEHAPRLRPGISSEYAVRQ